MQEKTQRDMVREVHQAMFGVPNTEDDGLIGDVKSIAKSIKDQNSRIGKSENAISRIKGYLIGVGVLGAGGAGFSIAQFLGG